MSKRKSPTFPLAYSRREQHAPDSLLRPNWTPPRLECWPTSLTRKQCGLPPLESRKALDGLWLLIREPDKQEADQCATESL